MILLPIKPKYAFAIQNKAKMVEFRKIKFKNLDSDICVVYASSPYKKIIWYFKIKQIHEEKISKIWNKYKDVWGINKAELEEYYKNKDVWYVIEIEEFFPFNEHISPNELIKDFKIPQSFKYLNDMERQLFFYNNLQIA